jgi:hypothetical protein
MKEYNENNYYEEKAILYYKKEVKLICEEVGINFETEKEKYTWFIDIVINIIFT